MSAILDHITGLISKPDFSSPVGDAVGAEDKIVDGVGVNVDVGDTETVTDVDGAGVSVGVSVGVREADGVASPNTCSPLFPIVNRLLI